ncbi:MAG TPA: hypothetical protein VHO28_11205 [Ignavibacteriales bacterium]|nr:hypothetical protein [Ignavibacteriales bacterium]
MNLICKISLALLIFNCQAFFAQTNEIYKMPVAVVKYFPVDGNNIDIKITGDYGVPLAKAQAKIDSLTPLLAATLEKNSIYRGYKDNSAAPSLDYEIVKEFEFHEAVPTYNSEDHKVPMTDYNAIMKKINAEYLINQLGVKEIWVWGYQGDKVDLWESNMSSKYGDVSNSDRSETDLPVYDHTYIVYHYNYQRALSEAVEDHMHQIEALLNHIDGRDTTAEKDWGKLLFWGKFVGSDATYKIVNPGCGWAHYPPNAVKDYDWKNKTYVWTDIEDWQPDGTGKKININCERWNCKSVDWFTYWMQSLPGKNNGLKYNGKSLTNWWQFVGDWDNAKKNNIGLTGK